MQLQAANVPVTLQAMQVNQAMVAEAGFNVSLQATQFTTLLAAQRSGDFQISRSDWSGRLDPDGNVVWQYLYWLGNLLRGDLGISLRANQPVTDLILEKLPVTIQLAVLAMILAMGIGLPAGILAAVHKNSALDVTANLVALSGLSVPNFWLGIMLIPETDCSRPSFPAPSTPGCRCCATTAG
ncbi:ABC-type dipeptide/oligopeptide/nickel transport system permease component [Aureimonas pseudogalii]|uniref:ABC-type dipeptide/oligopeptide/nickel transport system permease component n=1 Tax=Aureimonas pseudogalii TaxID=1744844 RepID=A0A7W6MM71_9HYPH|nr:ABC-type dipeptide/oligopeptide/nickel transport system permease component [Aureimonas pseudogalii]